MAAAQQRLLECGTGRAVPLLTDGRAGGMRPALVQRLQLQSGEGTNPLPTEVQIKGLSRVPVAIYIVQTRMAPNTSSQCWLWPGGVLLRHKHMLHLI